MVSFYEHGDGPSDSIELSFNSSGYVQALRERAYAMKLSKAKIALTKSDLK
jgi:hypothetical protein